MHGRLASAEVPFFENLGSYVYDSMRARTVLFLKGISVRFFR